MNYRNIQGMRGIAALMVVSGHMFTNIAPMRTHWARPYFFIGGVSVAFFFVISGFIIYHVIQRSIASMDNMGTGRAVYAFAMKRFIRIYPLYWIVFGTACLVMAWAPPAAPPHEPMFLLLTLINNVPNFRVYVVWTLTFEVYFYAMVALSLFLLEKRAMVGLTFWLAAIGGASLLGWWVPLPKPLDFVFAPILLEILLGIAVAKFVEHGFRRFNGASLAGALMWIVIGTWFLRPAAFELNVDHLGRLVAITRSFALHVVCWGIPAALLVYGLVVVEIRQRWIMPRVLQSLGNASFSIYLWHAVVFNAVGELFVRLGWVGVVSSTGLTVLMVAIGLAVGIASHHFLEKPIRRRLGDRLLSRGVSSRSLEAGGYAR